MSRAEVDFWRGWNAIVYCWQLLVCENTLIQVVTLKKTKNKKQKKKSYPR